MTTEAQRRAADKYIKSNVFRVTVTLTPKDADLIEHLKKQGSKSGYLKQLVRRDMECGRKEYAVSERHEEMGMTEQQFASYLNQLIGRFEDAEDIEDDEKRARKFRDIIEDMKADRDSKM